MSLWLDYSFSRPALPKMKQDGVAGVLRYLSPDDQNTHGKILFLPELQALRNAGFDVALNFEWYQGRCNEGAAAGGQDARTALQMAQALGYPQGSTIYFSHDTGAYNWSSIEAYFREVKSVLGSHYQVGAYGSFILVQHLHGLGLADRGWQTTAWSGGSRDRWSVLYQDGTQLYNGAADTNQVSGDVGGFNSNGGGLVSAEYDALAKKIDNLGDVLVNQPEHAGHRTILGAINNLGASQKGNDTALANALVAVSTTVQSLTAEVAALQAAIGVLAQPVGASAKDIVTELGVAIAKGEQPL